jgi:hypothetical protein
MIFKYQPRTSTQIERRIHQSRLGDWKMALTHAREAKPVAVAPKSIVKVETEPDDATARKAKKGTRTLCVDCGHEQGDHHMHPSGHHVDGNWLFYCISSHCCALVRNADRTFSDCTCLHFRATADAVPELTRPQVDDWTPCAACGHWRSKHCTRRKVDPAKPLSVLDWKGLTDENDLAVPCSHTTTAKNYACGSSACATVLGEGDEAKFCDCKKFVSPFLKKKPAKRSKIKSLIPVADLERAHRDYLAQQSPQPKSKEQILVEVFREDSTLTPAQLSEASGHSQAWVRKHLRAAGLLPPSRKKAQTAFVTGEPMQVNP